MNGAAELTITVLLRIRIGITDHRDQRPMTSGVCSLRSGRVFSKRAERTSEQTCERESENMRRNARALVRSQFLLSRINFLLKDRKSAWVCMWSVNNKRTNS